MQKVERTIRFRQSEKRQAVTTADIVCNFDLCKIIYLQNVKGRGGHTLIFKNRGVKRNA
jgi:hypothetical protein